MAFLRGGGVHITDNQDKRNLRMILDERLAVMKRRKNDIGNFCHCALLIRSQALLTVLALLWCFASSARAEEATIVANEKYPGYQSLWYSHTPDWKGEIIPGRSYEYGPKQGGGLGTYQAVHLPRAVYVPEAEKTFFAYGGAKNGGRHLLVMASYYDHRTGMVPQPTIVHDKEGVDDAHDNPVITLDEHGHVWVFVAGRSRVRPGFIYRSLEPYSTDAFEQLLEGEFAYPQPWWLEGKGFLWLHTRYTRGRELYFATSADGRSWSEPQKLAGMRGHYQVSHAEGERVVTAFSWHPEGKVDLRTNLYYLETRDMGTTWQTADGQTVDIPLTDDDVHGAALVHDFQAEGRLVYVNDIRLDAAGNPVVVAVTSTDHRPGPYGEPRFYTMARWDGDTWRIRNIAPTTNNYDMGSLHIEEGNVWRFMAPSEPGPQRWGTGGEVAAWLSTDQGETWTKTRDITWDSPRNHSYVRRPLDAHDDFYAMWADGNWYTFTQSFLYFTNRAGDRVWQLPYTMDEEFAAPEVVERWRGD